MSTTCAVCQQSFTQKFNYKRHLDSVAHCAKLRKIGQANEIGPSNSRQEQNITRYSEPSGIQDMEDPSEDIHSQYDGGKPKSYAVGFFHPFTGIIAGPTGSGKSVFVFKFIRDIKNLMFPPPERIIYCYGEYQDVFADFPEVEFTEGLPRMTDFDGSQRILLIIDDLMHEAGDEVTKIFTKGSHHRNISVFFLTQNLFFKSKGSRTMSLNAQYIVVFKSVRGSGQVSNLAGQIFPGHSKYMMEAYLDSTSKPFGYLLIDLKPQTPDELRLRSNIFSNETNFAYVRKL
jgi:hypothetical protein